MKYSAKQYSVRSIALLRRASARIDRRTRWTLGPLLVIVLFSVPFWSAAMRLSSPGLTSADSLHVPILVYHSIAPNHVGQSAEQRLLDVDTAAFRRQMAYLAANRYNVVPLGTLLNALEGRGTVPEHSVVITFDDGWLSQYENALPILEEMHFTATFFIITRQVGMGPKYMDLDQVKSLQRAGMTIASHSRTHPMLAKLGDARLRDEVSGSRQDLQKMFGVTTDLFAYPYGSRDRRVDAAVRSAGYRGARALAGGAWNDGTDVYALHSILVTDDMDAFTRALGAPTVATRDSVWRVAVTRR